MAPVAALDRRYTIEVDVPKRAVSRAPAHLAVRPACMGCGDGHWFPGSRWLSLC